MIPENERDAAYAQGLNHGSGDSRRAFAKVMLMQAGVAFKEPLYFLEEPEITVDYTYLVTNQFKCRLLTKCTWHDKDQSYS